MAKSRTIELNKGHAHSNGTVVTKERNNWTPDANGRKSVIDKHPNRRDIEKDLMERVLSPGQLNKKWGIDKKTLMRHYIGLVRTLGPLPKPDEATIMRANRKYEKLVARDELEWMHNKLKGVIEKVEKKELYGNLAKMFEIDLQAIRTVAEMDKEIGVGSVQQVATSQHLHLVKVIQTPKLSDPERVAVESLPYSPPKILLASSDDDDSSLT